MRLRLWTALLTLSVLPFAALAQDAGVISAGGVAITPATEGNLLVLYPTVKGHEGLPTYTLVKTGGKAVVIMTPQGIALTPAEAWDTYAPSGHRAKPKPSAEAVPAQGGTFSVPNARHY